MRMNRLGNAQNPHQGKAKRVLCVCSAGLLRSPTAAVVLSQEPFNFNTRAAGIDEEYALIPVDDVLVAWADQIVCMERGHEEELLERFPGAKGKVVVLGIMDNYAYRDPQLVRLITQQYKVKAEAWSKVEEV